MRLSRLFLVLFGIAVGATGALLLDPRLGARRRALTRDKLRHYLRIAPRRLRGIVRRVQGPLRGALHTVAKEAPWRETEPPPDLDEYIKHRVETELGRRRDIHLGTINIDAVDGVVRVRGQVPDEEMARRIVQAAAAVEGVRAVTSMMHTPDGRVVPCEAGDTSLLHGRPRAAVQGETLRRKLQERWPALTDADLHACGGHPDKLAAMIAARTGRPEAEVRAALDEILLAAV